MKNFKFFVCSVLVLWALLGSCKNGSDSDGENPDFPENLAEYVGNENYKSPKNVEINAEAAKNQSEGLKGDFQLPSLRRGRMKCVEGSKRLR